ncbi:MAG: PASTA domain-containing protein [Peptostreptococcaceae bacterium]|nr:PASTA domain-containing protein [Peptostreptococcaceae bacterium]
MKKRKTNKNRIDSLNRHRIIAIFSIVLVVFTVLVFRVAYIQVVKVNELNAEAAKVQTEDTDIEPKRGSIYDRNGKELAISATSYKIYAYNQSLYANQEKEQKEKVVEELAEILDIKNKELTEVLGSDKSMVQLGEEYDYEVVKKVMDLGYASIVVRTSTTRVYPNGAFMSQLLGGMTADNTGRYGLEYQYNDELTGVFGRWVKNTDRDGNTLAEGQQLYYEASDGNNLILTTDEVIGHYVEEALDEAMEKTDANKITCVVMDPKTGDVLAMSTVPDYDPNTPSRPADEEEYEEFKKLSYQEQSDYLNSMWRNPIVSDVYEPGSTFKLVCASSAIEEGTTTSESTYACNTKINVADTTLNCWSSVSHGIQTIKEAVGNSCNPALAQVALDLGREGYFKYLGLYGFTGITGIDLPGESSAILQDKDTMSVVDLATMGYGQGIAVTPIQLISAICAMGNDGKLMQAKVVKSITNSEGETVKEYEDKVVRKVISEETADEMREIMEYYITDGGGKFAQIPGYRVGGKSGTAYIANESGYSTDTNSSFICMAPMNDPQIVVLVIVDTPKGSYYGAATAGPPAKEILEKSLVYLNIEPSYTESEIATIESGYVVVPKLVGYKSGVAINMVEVQGLEWNISPTPENDEEFVVVDQYPKAGEKIKQGETVQIYWE